ncbi:hypothetical protein Patl1_22227 [Pistacia atlantica]|uniref:Uncharacterized protein n=1 Tax=Pistacia atlantica TaxID=434234 RepID=A0ACC1BM42_9ROSI|nr:hypothetical protein Patl1_22227 [Pistacia atlantica]
MNMIHSARSFSKFTLHTYIRYVMANLLLKNAISSDETHTLVVSSQRHYGLMLVTIFPGSTFHFNLLRVIFIFLHHERNRE